MKNKELYIPKYRFRFVTDITPDDLRAMGAKAVGLDIDNVIAPDGTFKYADGVKEWVASIKEAGFPIMLISNGTLMRIMPVVKYLDNLPFIHLSRKPSPRALIKAAKKMNVDISALAMLGDQIFSDILAANRCGAIPVRIDPLPGKSLYPHYYAWKAKREEPYIKEFEKNHGYGVSTRCTPGEVDNKAKKE